MVAASSDLAAFLAVFACDLGVGGGGGSIDDEDDDEADEAAEFEGGVMRRPLSL